MDAKTCKKRGGTYMHGEKLKLMGE